MRKQIVYLATLLALLVAISSCRKEDTPAPSAVAGKVLLEFNNKVGGVALDLGTSTWYKNEHGDSFTVSKFNYYISNIVLQGTDVADYTETDSYHLLEQSDLSSLNFDLMEVPAGTYKSISFLIGVDSAHNVSGAQTGALDPAKGMFWSWSTGYIMLKMEGVSPQSPQAGNNFLLHAGGFTGPNSVLRTVTLDLPNTITVNGDENHIHIGADVQKVLGGPNPIDFSTTSVIMSANEAAKKMADNYQNMFVVSLAGK